MEAGSSHDKRAPEPLGVVQRFVNSLDLDEGREELGTPEELSSWLVERGLMAAGEPVTDGDVRRAIEVREGLRSLLLAHNGAPRDDAAVARLDRASARAGLRAGFEPGQPPALVPDAT